MRLIHKVRTPLGVCEVTLDREGMNLDERGGFSAVWSANDREIVDLETYRGVVKTELAEQYRRLHGREPGALTLNLASHQLIDDLVGWTKLNWQPPG